MFYSVVLYNLWDEETTRDGILWRLWQQITLKMLRSGDKMSDPCMYSHIYILIENQLALLHSIRSRGRSHGYLEYLIQLYFIY